MKKARKRDENKNFQQKNEKKFKKKREKERPKHLNPKQVNLGVTTRARAQDILYYFFSLY